MKEINMAKGKTETVVKININNSKVSTTVSKVVEQVVIDGQLQPDKTETDRGVVV